MRGLTE